MNRIGDHALIGDCHSAALVALDGSIDWCCFPRFDSPSVFAAILDDRRGGSFDVAPEDVRSTRRAYLDGTNVLVTTFDCAEGTLELTDLMPVGATEAVSHHTIVRRLRCTHGIVTARLRVAPRFEYGRFVPAFRLSSDETAEIVGGADALWLDATRILEERDDAIEARWRLRAGETVWVRLTWTSSVAYRPSHASTPEELLDATVGFWRAWLARCWYTGEHADAVRRSALVLKLLTYAPSGAVVAAPTTSLPEEIGGVRNWDYRYTWIRDATLTLISLFIAGFRAEADAFRRWLERTSAGRSHDLQIMYGIDGRRSLPELELPHLSGHRGSAPVRIGNGAVSQLQLDSYGQLLEAAYLYARAGGRITPDNWRYLESLVDVACERWRSPDNGIWEMRDEPRHFVHSKVNCWVALDRAVRIAQARRMPAPVERWTRERDALSAYLLDAAAEHGRFTQAAGHPAADASTLLVPALGFLPTGHPHVLATIDAVRSELSHDGLVHRYVASDGLAGGEGAFLLCSFWLLDCLTFAGRIDEAEALLDRLLGLSNDVGLYAEEVDPSTGDALGNFPQAFTHMALVTSCAHLDAGRRGELPPPGEACAYAEVALRRLLSAGRGVGERSERPLNGVERT